LFQTKCQYPKNKFESFTHKGVWGRWLIFWHLLKPTEDQKQKIRELPAEHLFIIP